MLGGRLGGMPGSSRAFAMIRPLRGLRVPPGNRGPTGTFRSCFRGRAVGTMSSLSSPDRCFRISGLPCL
eukprot:3330250-Alexandrium_andersonii.AAC.1